MTVIGPRPASKLDCSAGTKIAKASLRNGWLRQAQSTTPPAPKARLRRCGLEDTVGHGGACGCAIVCGRGLL